MPTNVQNQLPSLAGAAWLVRPDTQAVFAALAAAGDDARAVGGVVRNALMGLPVTDIDIATPAIPEAVIAAAKAAGLGIAETGLDHGTVTVIANHMPHEVTTLRRDVSTDGRRATVAFTTDWAEDARRRDFTMNAIYCDAAGRVFDPLGGYPDLLARRVRFIGDADQRIAEDYLRILRFFRFHAVLGEGPLDSAGLAACIRGRHGLDRLSSERVRSELLRLLTGTRVRESIEAMIDCGLLAHILRRAPRPGVLASLIVAEDAVATGTSAATGTSTAASSASDEAAGTSAEAASSVTAKPDAIPRLSALAVAVAEDIPALADHLRLSNDERDALLVIDQPLHATFDALDEAAAKRQLYRLGAEGWRRSVLGALAVEGMSSARSIASRAASTHAVAPAAATQPAAAPRAASLRDLYALPDRWPIPRFPVKGADVLALGIAPGPAVGRILAEVEAWWIDAGFPPEAEVRQQLEAQFGAR